MRPSSRKLPLFFLAVLFAVLVAAPGHAFVGGGDAAAKFGLAQQYENAEGVARDYGRAFHLYCEAAAFGHAGAAYSIGWMYLNGRGVARDDAVGVAWLRLAAERGDDQAARLLTRLASVEPSRPAGCWGGGKGSATIVAPKAIAAIVTRTAAKYGVDERLVLAVIAAESAFQVDAVSPRNAQGLMQLMPETAERFNVKQVFEPTENIRGGTQYLKWLIARFEGDLPLVLAAYNAGEAAVEQYGGIPPYPETRAFVERVRNLY